MLGAASSVAACSGDSTLPIVPASVAVKSPALVLHLGERVRLSAVTRDERGAVMPKAHVQWSTSNPAYVTVNDSGVAAGVGAGAAVITASIDGVMDSVALDVDAPPASLDFVSPARTFNGYFSVGVGEIIQFRVVVRDALGHPLAHERVVWSTAPAIRDADHVVIGAASVDSLGRMIGLRTGWVYISAYDDRVQRVRYVYVR
jgi:hypothetical protein